ncbi:hypothetical protein [Thalassotalea agarivorans]|uniref:Uncharacterized protein n=1 Tax=Thalassotalea agarivorans TaxID=349064 RepID=A0A1I0FY18_THASX|nr:hypothetical protein [Thalassotalea agarivorans]SET62495.1 hypothetical protein SAMN05660429_02249 [Thalassotalea agarivorans]
MRKLTLLSLLTFAAISAQLHAIGGGDESTQKPNIAFACKDCTLTEAETIAIENAPVNDCDIYRNGSTASFCEAVRQDILIPVTNTRYVYKFVVTTTIDSQNRPVVNLFRFPLTTDQTSLMNMYFDFNEEMQAAISNASIDESEMFPEPNFTITSFSPENGTSAGNECKNHPTQYFRGLNEKRAIRSELAARITAAINGSTAVEFTQEPLPTGGGLNLATNGAAVSVNFQYFQANQIVTRGTDFNNRLAFDVNIAGDVTSNNVAVFSLTLNKTFTKIDGLKYSELFGSDVDLAGVGISNCLRKFLEEESEEVPEDQLPPAGGSGSFNDPFTGADANTNIDPIKFCEVPRRLKTCSTLPNGSVKCTYTTFTMLTSCGFFKPDKPEDK